MLPPITRGTFHQARSTNFAKTVARNVPIDPSATLSPMIEERSSFLGGAPGIAGGGAPGAAAGGGGGAGAPATAAPAVAAPSFAVVPVFAADARFTICPP